MSNLPEDQTDNWDCEYLAVMILQQQEADEDNREVYRVQKCRMKKELIDMEKDMKGKGQVKRRRIIQSIIQIAKQFEEPLKLRDKSKSKDIQIRELKKLVDTSNGKLYSLDIYWKKMQMQYYWYMITPATVTQYENYSDIEQRQTNYDHLMLDMEKEWLIKQQQKQMTFT